MADPSNPQKGAQTDRFGGRSYTDWRFLRRGITSVESLPTADLECLVPPPGGKHVEWLVVKPTGVTGYQVTIGRWVYVQRNKGAAAVETFVVLDVQSYTTDAIISQEAVGDRVLALITQITGTAGTGFDVAYRGRR